MMRTWTALWIGLVLIGTGDNPVAAQELRPAVFGAAAVANVYRTEDQSFGTELNVGGGLGIEWKRLGLDAEMHRTLGLTPRGGFSAGSSTCLASAPRERESSRRRCSQGISATSSVERACAPT
jgi:hypothetical protein